MTYPEKPRYRGYEIHQITEDIVEAIRDFRRLGRYLTIEQAKRDIDHFLDRECNHRECR